MKELKVFAPATVANVVCGFDVLGFALNHPGDTLIAEKNSDNQLKISAKMYSIGVSVAPTCKVGLFFKFLRYWDAKFFFSCRFFVSRRFWEIWADKADLFYKKSIKIKALPIFQEGFLFRRNK